MLNKEVAPSMQSVSDLQDTPRDDSEESFSNFYTDRPLFPNEKDDPACDDEEPETVIGENVQMKGELTFKTLLRIDGIFEGELISDGKLIVGPKASVKADIHLAEAFVSGKIEGNITVKERLVLRGRAEVHGDITAPLLSVDEGVSIVGRVNVCFQSEL